MHNTHDRRRELDPVSKIVLTVIVISVLLIATYAVITYAARVDEARPHAGATPAPVEADVKP